MIGAPGGLSEESGALGGEGGNGGKEKQGEKKEPTRHSDLQKQAEDGLEVDHLNDNGSYGRGRTGVSPGTATVTLIPGEPGASPEALQDSR